MSTPTMPTTSPREQYVAATQAYLQDRGPYSRPGFFAVALDYLRERSGIKNASKLFSYGVFWANFASDKLRSNFDIHFPVSPVATALAGRCSQIKTALGPLEIPEKLSKAWTSTLEFWKSRTVKSGIDAARDGSFLVNALSDGLDFAKEFVEIGKDYLKAASSINVVATVIGSGILTSAGFVNIASSLEKVLDDKVGGQSHQVKKQRLYLNLINQARNISYLALGCLGVASGYYGVAVASWVFTTAATSGTLFGVGGDFYERMVDPNNKFDPLTKGLSADPRKEIALVTA